MTKAEAHELLNQRRDGVNMPQAVIVAALKMTGDIQSNYTVRQAMRDCLQDQKTADAEKSVMWW